jgi:hypothetical protein
VISRFRPFAVSRLPDNSAKVSKITAFSALGMMMESPPLSDKQLISTAEELFLELDRKETADA